MGHITQTARVFSNYFYLDFVAWYIGEISVKPYEIPKDLQEAETFSSSDFAMENRCVLVCSSSQSQKQVKVCRLLMVTAGWFFLRTKTQIALKLSICQLVETMTWQRDDNSVLGIMPELYDQLRPKHVLSFN